jgi:hypothetical protein
MWNDPSTVLGVPLDLDEEKTSLVKKVNLAEIVVAKTKAAGVSKLKIILASVWQTRGTIDTCLGSVRPPLMQFGQSHV